MTKTLLQFESAFESDNRGNFCWRELLPWNQRINWILQQHKIESCRKKERPYFLFVCLFNHGVQSTLSLCSAIRHVGTDELVVTRNTCIRKIQVTRRDKSILCILKISQQTLKSLFHQFSSLFIFAVSSYFACSGFCYFSHITAAIRKLWDEAGHRKTWVGISIICNMLSGH